MKFWNIIWLAIAAAAAVAMTYAPKSDAASLIKVGVIDTGLDLKDPRFAGALCPIADHKDFTGEGIRDTNDHGTHIAGLIMQQAGGPNHLYCLQILKYFSEKAAGHVNLAREIMAIRFAAEHGAAIINLSSNGGKRDTEEYDQIAAYPGVHFVVAAGNEGGSAAESYPCAYRSTLANVTCVGALDRDKHWDKSNSGPGLEWEPGRFIRGFWPNGAIGYMSGTSQATALYTGKLVKSLLTGQ